MIPQPATFPSTHQESSVFFSSRWLLGLGLLVLTSMAYAEIPAVNSEEVALGRRIYMEGILPSGEPLKGMRQNVVQLEGATAACETCHRRSGIGSLEANISVKPITGAFLFATDDNRPMALLDTRAANDITKPHAPYTEASLAKAIREGINVSGRQMNLLMPHYALSDRDIKALTAYLRQLSSELSPGVGEDTLQFATIITPDVDPKKAEVMVRMMHVAFDQRNISQQVYSGRMRSPLDLLPRKLRNWQLKVWQLTGAPETWAAQLAENYRRNPVFAVISGVSNSTWEPVSQFCEQEKLPCLLPSVPLPPIKSSFYLRYFSRGVALEADVLATQLRNKEIKSPQRLLQIYRNTEVGRGAAQKLSEDLKGSDVKVEDRILASTKPADIKALLKWVSSQDVVMLWLNPADLAAVNKAAPKQVPAVVYVSGFLADEDYSFVSKAWKSHVRVVYPYELGEKRQKNADKMKQWLKTWQLPLVDEPFQNEVFFDLLLITDLSSQMLDNFYRDYLVERTEDMLSIGSNVSAYPYLSLSRNQGFASKGAYIAHLDAKGELVADTEWLIP